MINYSFFMIKSLAIINGWRLFQGFGWKMLIVEVMNAGYRLWIH